MPNIPVPARKPVITGVALCGGGRSREIISVQARFLQFESKRFVYTKAILARILQHIPNTCLRVGVYTEMLVVYLARPPLPTQKRTAVATAHQIKAAPTQSRYPVFQVCTYNIKRENFSSNIR
jgi:hypothetical protein